MSDLCRICRRNSRRSWTRCSTGRTRSSARCSSRRRSSSRSSTRSCRGARGLGRGRAADCACCLRERGLPLRRRAEQANARVNPSTASRPRAQVRGEARGVRLDAGGDPRDAAQAEPAAGRRRGPSGLTRHRSGRRRPPRPAHGTCAAIAGAMLLHAATAAAAAGRCCWGGSQPGATQAQDSEPKHFNAKRHAARRRYHFFTSTRWQQLRQNN